MLAQSTPTRRIGDGLKLRPACPNCGRSMHQTCTPGMNGPGLEAFRCGECGIWLTEDADERARQAH